jgi:hypothetical protein
MTTEQIIAIVGLAISAIEKLAEGLPPIIAIVRQLRTTLAAMVSEGRDPTPAEWDALNAQIAEAMAGLKQ